MDIISDDNPNMWSGQTGSNHWVSDRMDRSVRRWWRRGGDGGDLAISVEISPYMMESR